jgi:hypothetical protein
MDRLEKSTSNDNEGFIKTVFPFDEGQKGTLLNILQYSVLAIIPIVILLKLIKEYIPEADDDKSSIMVSVEVIGQIFIMFMALYFIHQIIAYIPTYSGKGYGDVNIINIVAPILFIAITMQTKLGEKIHMLLDRLWDVYDGRSSSTNDKQQKQGQVRVTQPISGQQQMPSTVNPPPQLQSQMTNMKAQSHEFTIPQTPNFDNMYAGPETPLVGAANPQTGQIDNFEPMAANDGFGAFGTAF